MSIMPIRIPGAGGDLALMGQAAAAIGQDTAFDQQQALRLRAWENQRAADQTLVMSELDRRSSYNRARMQADVQAELAGLKAMQHRRMAGQPSGVQTYGRSPMARTIAAEATPTPSGGFDHRDAAASMGHLLTGAARPDRPQSTMTFRDPSTGAELGTVTPDDLASLGGGGYVGPGQPAQQLSPLTAAKQAFVSGIVRDRNVAPGDIQALEAMVYSDDVDLSQIRVAAENALRRVPTANAGMTDYQRMSSNLRVVSDEIESAERTMRDTERQLLDQGVPTTIRPAEFAELTRSGEIDSATQQLWLRHYAAMRNVERLRVQQRQLLNTPSAQPQTTGQPSGPQPGTEDEGFRFLGGDPANADNWEPV